jgi:hypothetical protein
MRKPRDIDGELAAIRERQRVLEVQRTAQFGELVEATGADTLSIEALVGALLAAVEAMKEPETVARWTERGQTFFRTRTGAGGKSGTRGKRASGGKDGGSPTEAAGDVAAGHPEPGSAPAKDGSSLL